MQNEVIPCACGCGETLPRFDGRGRERKFLINHHAKLQPNQRTEVRCEQCGNPLNRPQWHLRRKLSHTFCSHQCCAAWRIAHGHGRGAENGHYNSITVPCGGCGSPVTKAVSLVKRRNHRVYCPTCIPTHARVGRPGFYVGYPKEFSAPLRHRIRRRDRFACQLCGQPQSETGTLHVHHIDYVKENNHPSNLIALCHVCHGRTNFAEEVWKGFFQQRMQERGIAPPGPG